jgi:hypothetical protein
VLLFAYIINILVGISDFIMSGGLLCKMLILGINEMVLFGLSSEVLKGYLLIFDLQDQYFY